jgi:hypothetical protein
MIALARLGAMAMDYEKKPLVQYLVVKVMKRHLMIL